MCLQVHTLYIIRVEIIKIRYISLSLFKVWEIEKNETQNKNTYLDYICPYMYQLWSSLVACYDFCFSFNFLFLSRLHPPYSCSWQYPTPLSISLYFALHLVIFFSLSFLPPARLVPIFQTFQELGRVEWSAWRATSSPSTSSSSRLSSGV